MGKYQFNESCFDKINENSAYWLGFLFADGCIFRQKGKSQPYVAKLVLKKEDEETIAKFMSFLETNSPIKYYKNSVGVYIHNQTICEKLLSLGVIPNKSLVLEFPKYIQDSPFVNHFIRGYFDGDGCISLINRKTKFGLHFTIVGTLNFIQNIQNILILKCGIGKTKIIKQGKVFSLHVCKEGDIYKIKRFLYDNAKFFMGRKFATFSTDLSQKKNGSQVGVCKRGNKFAIYYYNESGKRKEQSGFNSFDIAKSCLNNLLLSANNTLKKPKEFQIFQ